MILGILSDTHGHARRTAAAVRLLQQLGAEAFVHCGDVGSPDVLDELAGRRAWVVLGNTDWEEMDLAAYGAALGSVVGQTVPLRFELAGHGLAVFHGHEPQFAALLDDTPATAAYRADLQACEYILHGHRHVASDVRLGPWRLINPGALYRASVHTVATLDLDTDELQFWQVVDEPRRGQPPVPFRPG